MANNVQIRLGARDTRTDAEIARAVRHALILDAGVPDAHIRSTVSGGWVSLQGDVDCWTQRENASRAVRNITGICGVTNEIEIKCPPIAPTELRKRILAALGRQLESEAPSVRIDVREDSVKLTGTVHSWAEKQAIVGAIRGTQGVRCVENRLRVDA